MLQMALNRHSQVVIPPETAFFTLLTRSIRGQAVHWKRIELDLKISIPDRPRRLRPGPAAAAIFTGCLSAFARGIGKFGPETRFGEKSPEHQRRVDEILETYPGAKFILIYRDGRDVALSLTKVPFMPGDLYVGFELWRYYHRLQMKLQATLADRIHVVQYERLVADPKPELDAVQRFLGLPIEEDVAFGEGNTDGVPEHEYSYKRLALGPISASRVGDWKSKLSIEQLRILEARGGAELASLGYELVSGQNRLPICYMPLTGWRILRWLGWRSVTQWLDEYWGTSLNPAHRALRRDNSTEVSSGARSSAP